MQLRSNVSFVVMIKNEEYWIELALRPLIATRLPIFVVDTGSSDNTRSILADLKRGNARLHVTETGELDATELGLARGVMAERAKTKWIFVVDGDEIYTHGGIASILNFNMPENTISGFTTMQNLHFGTDGFPFPTNKYSAHRVHLKTAQWHGEYPFESTEHFRHEGDDRFFYFPVPRGRRCHGFHARYAKRSSLDEGTFFRTEKIGYFDNSPSGDAIDLFGRIGSPIFSNPYWPGK